MRTLSLDIGKKKIGVAVSDALGITAQGLETIVRKNKKVDLESIKAVVQKMNVSKIVAGLPLNMDGSEGAMAKEVYAFADELKKEIAVPVDFWDERLSTLEAERVLLKADVSRKKRKKVDDKIAAQLILQGYLASKDRYS